MTAVMLFWLIYSANGVSHVTTWIISHPYPLECVLCSKVLAVITWRFNVLLAHCQGSCTSVILYIRGSTHSSLNILSFVCVWAVNSQAQLPPGHRSGGFCSADDLLMWIPVRQKGKCLCLQVFPVSRVTTAVTLSPFCLSLLGQNAT